MKSLDQDSANGYRVFIFVLAIIIQTLFISTNSLGSYSLYLSYITSFPIVFAILMWVDIRSENIIIQNHLKPFSLTTTEKLLIRWKYMLFNKKYGLYIVLIYSSLLLLPNVNWDHKALYFIWSVLQTNVFLLGIIVLYDFLEAQDLSRHVLTLPSFLILFDSLLDENSKMYLFVSPYSVGCAAVELLDISSFVVKLLFSCLIFIALAFSLIMIRKVFHHTWINDFVDFTVSYHPYIQKSKVMSLIHINNTLYACSYLV